MGTRRFEWTINLCPKQDAVQFLSLMMKPDGQDSAFQIIALKMAKQEILFEQKILTNLMLLKIDVSGSLLLLSGGKITFLSWGMNPGPLN